MIVALDWLCVCKETILLSLFCCGNSLKVDNIPPLTYSSSTTAKLQLVNDMDSSTHYSGTEISNSIWLLVVLVFLLGY